jgi:hypothetical protein
MKVIFDEFLPLSWRWSGGEGEEEGDESPGSKEEVAHGRPQVAALKLVMAVCSAGRNLTSQLVRMIIKGKYSMLAKSRLPYSGKNIALILAKVLSCSQALPINGIFLTFHTKN